MSTAVLTPGNSPDPLPHARIAAAVEGFRLLVLSLMAAGPVFGIAYLAAFQDPALVAVAHTFHEIAIGVSILLAAFVALVTWTCYDTSGEVLTRFLTLGFLGFAVVYTPHGLLTEQSGHNMALFLLYGPASRMVMAFFLFLGLLAYRAEHDPPAVRRRASVWLPWILPQFVVVAAVWWVATTKVVDPSIVRVATEGTAIALCAASLLVMAVKRIRGPLVWCYAVALVWFALSSGAFFLARPWNHQWWLAHAIFAGGFFLLSYGVVRAYQTTRAFSRLYSAEVMMGQLADSRAAVSTKEMLLRELNHRVKNSLQIVANLLILEEARSRNADLRSVLTEIRGRLDAISLIHRRLYQADYEGHFDAASTLTELCENLLAVADTGNRIQFRLEVQPVQVTVDQGITLMLLVNELVTNAVKHGFPKGRSGTLWVRLVRRGAHAVLEVEDDGVGFGKSDQSGDGLGLRLSRQMAGELGGRLEVVTGAGGTRFSVDFPLTAVGPRVAMEAATEA